MLYTRTFTGLPVSTLFASASMILIVLAALSSVTRYGVALLLLGVTEGEAREGFREIAEESQPSRDRAVVTELEARR